MLSLKNIPILIISSMIFLFSGCASTYAKFYTEYDYTPSLRDGNGTNVIWLADGETPQVFTTDNLERDVPSMVSKRYIPIGQSSFNGDLEDKNSVINHAKNIKATAALYTWKYIDTQTNSGTLVLPTTNYFSGTVTGNGGFASFNGSTTGTTATPYSFTQRRYDQTAVFFIKDLSKKKFGVIPRNIARDLQILIGHTGVIIDNIFEDTPAYKSTLLIGDIVIEVDNQKVDSVESFLKILEDKDVAAGYSDWKIYRNKKEEVIRIKL